MKPLSSVCNRFLSPSFLTAISLGASSISQAASLTWDSGVTNNGAAIDPAAGTWNTTAGNTVWNNATTNVIWSQTSATAATNSAIFGGADGTYAITVGTALATSGLTFNNSGYTLSAASAQTINLSGAVLVATTKSATIGSNVVVERTAASTLLGTTAIASGTLNITSGGTLRGTATGGYLIAGVGTVINVNGTLARTNTTDAAANLLQLAPGTTDDVTVNVESGGLLSVGGRRIETGFWGKGTVNVKAGGTFTMTSTTGGHIYAGFGNGTASGNGTINVTGGTVTTGTVGETIIGGALSTGALSVSSGTWTSNGRMALAENGNGTVTLSDTGSISVKSTTTGVNFASGTNAAAVGTLNLNGGTLTTPAINKITTGASATLNFNGGTLKANKTNTTFLTGLNVANVHDLGAIIDSNGFDITIDQPLTHSVLSGAAAIDGGLTKKGNGTLTLTSAGSTYTGATTINGGTLLLNNLSLTTHSGMAIGASGTLRAKASVTSAGNLSSLGLIDLTNAAGNALDIGGSLTLTSSTLNFDLLTGYADQITCGGSVTASGTNTINLGLVTGETVTSGTYTLITAASGLDVTNFALGARPPGFSTYSLSTPSPTALLLTVLAGNATPATAYWTGLASSTGSPTDAANAWGYGSALVVSKSNWSTTADGLNDPKQIPGTITDVFLTASNATGISGALNTRLDAPYSINSLTIDVPSSTGITATTVDTNAFSLTLAGGGLTLAATSNSGAVISGSGSIIPGTDQSWSNNSSQALTITAAINATSSCQLTLNGTGTGGLILGGPISNGNGLLSLIANQAGLTTLGGSCTFTGPTSLTAGRLLFENLSSYTSVLSLGVAVPDAATFHQDTQNLVLSSTGPITGSGGIVKTGNASLTLSNGSSTYAGGTVINGGTLIASSSPGQGSAAGQGCTLGLMDVGNIITINSGGTLTINGTAPLGNSDMLPAYSPSVVVNAGGAINGGAFVAFLPHLTLNGGTINVGTGNTTGAFNTNLGLVGTVVVGGSVPSTITTPVSGANATVSLGSMIANPGTTFQVANVTGDAAADLTISSILRNCKTAASPLIKTGPGTLSLTATNVYTGNTSVQQGTLSLSTASLANAADVSIDATGTLNLTHGLADTVHALFLNGTQVVAGTYVAVGSATPGIQTPRITGTGSLVVTTSPSPYDLWSGIIPNSADRVRTADPDGDGFSNLSEFLFGTSPIANNGSLVENSTSGGFLVVHWSQRKTVSTYVLQESATLADNPWPTSAVTPTNAVDQSGLYSTDYARKEALIPIDIARKFVRVKGTE